VFALLVASAVTRVSVESGVICATFARSQVYWLKNSTS
jgi:hypothetical protein